MSILEVVLWIALVAVLSLVSGGVSAGVELWFRRRSSPASGVDPEIQRAASVYAAEHADASLELMLADGRVSEIHDAARAWLAHQAERLYLTLAKRGITPEPLKLCRCKTAMARESEGLRPTCLDCSGVVLPHVVLCEPGRAIATVRVKRTDGLLTDPPAPGCAKIRVTTDDTEEGTMVHVLGANIEPLELTSVVALRRAGERIVLELCAEAVEIRGSLTRALDAASWH